MLLATRVYKPATALFSAAAAFGIWLKAAHWTMLAMLAGATASRFTPIIAWLAMMGLILASIRWKERLQRLPEPLLRFTRRTGLATYPIYLIHPLLGSLVIRGALLAGADRFVAITIAIAVVIVAGYGIALVIEPRVRRMLRALIFRSRDADPIA